MPSWKTPTPQQIERAVALLAHPVDQARFFEELQNPQWLAPLNTRGFLASPPGQEGAPSFAPWPASAYLARMAVHVPDEVLAILVKMKATNNVRVRQDIVDAALALPPALAAQLVSRNMTWLKERGPLLLLLPEKLAALAAHLARGGETATAWRVMRAVLHVEREIPAREGPEEVAGYAITPPLVPKARFDTWRYEQLVKHEVPALVLTSGKSGLVELVKLLREAISRATTHGAAPEDYLHVGRPAIEAHEQNRAAGINGPVDALVDAVRDAAIELVRVGTVPLNEVIALLDEQPWRTFRRLALHVLRTFAPEANDLISAHLADPELYATPAVFHEYVLLARAAFASLASDAQEAILRLGDEDQDEHWRERVFGAFREAIPPTAAERHPWLTTPAGGAAVAEEVGDSSDPFAPDRDFLATMRSWMGPTSPRSLEELRGLSVTEIAAEIANWTPEAALWRPSPEGFARVLQALVREQPDRFAREAEQFIGLPATYVGHLLFGLAEAARAQALLPWEPILRLCDWVVKQPATTSPTAGSSEREGGVECEPHTFAGGALPAGDVGVLPTTETEAEGGDDWAWARSNVARLLEAGVTMQDSAVAIPISLCQDIWHLLATLAENPNPTPEEDREFAEPEDGRSKMGPSGLALNSVRGAAFHALVRYALWLSRRVSERDTESRTTERDGHQATDDSPGRAEADTRGQIRVEAAEMLQQVLALLARHLDPSIDPSLAVRSIYGQFFPWLVAMDREWAATHVSSIFPAAPEQRKLHDAAWETYLTFCQPYRDVFSLLAGKYRRAVEALEPTGEGKAYESDQHIAPTPAWRLAEHLILLYLRGILTLDSGAGEGRGGVADNTDPSLLADFFRRAPDPIRAHAVEYAGLVFQHTEGEIPSDTRSRAERLWEARAAQAGSKPDGSRREMAAFGDWYGSGKLDRGKALRLLRQALGLSSGAIRSPHLVADRLAEDAEAASTDDVVQLVVECLGEMLFGLAGRLEIVSLIEPQARRILAVGHAARTPDVRRTADALINRLGGHGFIEFGDLMRQT